MLIKDTPSPNWKISCFKDLKNGGYPGMPLPDLPLEGVSR